MKNAGKLDNNPTTSIQSTAPPAPLANPATPIFIEAEKMFEKLAAITDDTARLAYQFFHQRGGEFGKEIEDWFRAENELIRPVPIEMTESDKNLVITAAVPGFKPEEIEVSVEDDTLILSGATESRSEEDPNNLMTEWSSNRFWKRLELPFPVAAESVTADLENGKLKLILPRTEAVEPVKVAVKSA